MLYQNYPNPFNPSTVISYQVSSVSSVRLAVYDLLGNDVAVLVHEEKSRGRYGVRLDASRLSSGVYFYRLEAGSYVATKRLVILR
jgi:hypothetical protein